MASNCCPNGISCKASKSTRQLKAILGGPQAGKEVTRASTLKVSLRALTECL